MSSGRTLEVALPPGPVGVGIRKAKDGSCYVHSVNSNDGAIANPLRVGDVILQLNSTKLGGSQGGLPHWVKMFAACASSTKNLLVRRQPSSGDTVSESIATRNTSKVRETQGKSNWSNGVVCNGGKEEGEIITSPTTPNRVPLSSEKGCHPPPASQPTNHCNERGDDENAASASTKPVPEKATAANQKDSFPNISQPTNRSKDHATGGDSPGKSVAEEESLWSGWPGGDAKAAAALGISVDELHARVFEALTKPQSPKKKKKKKTKPDPKWRPGMCGRPPKGAKRAYAKTAKGRKELAERGLLKDGQKKKGASKVARSHAKPEATARAGDISMLGSVIIKDGDADSVVSQLSCDIEDTAPRTPNVVPSPSSAIRRVLAHFGKNDADVRANKIAADPVKEPSEDELVLCLPKTQEERDQSRRAGYVPPIDLIAEKYQYMYLFREYKHISSQFKSIISSMDDPGIFSDQLEKGLCTRIMDSNFDMWLPPYNRPRDRPDGSVFPNDSLMNRFGALVWNMLGACDFVRDVSSTAYVLMAAVNDILGMTSDQDQFEHLIGLNLAIHQRELKDLLEKGDPATIKNTFGELAKAWKRLLDPNYDRRRCNASQALWEFAEGTCLIIQLVLERLKKTKGHDAPKYNFNYRRIPRPKRTKEGQQRKKEEDKKRKLERGRDAGTAKKKRKASPIDELINRIIAVEGVDFTDPVYDSCETVKSKIRAFLQRDGMTKVGLCRALGGINNNSLNRFLQASGQDQKGNETYAKAYCFFEKLRKLEGKPKSSDREMREMTMPDGFDVSKEPGGRSSYLIVPRW